MVMHVFLPLNASHTGLFAIQTYLILVCMLRAALKINTITVIITTIIRAYCSLWIMKICKSASKVWCHTLIQPTAVIEKPPEENSAQ